jgi:hypothetical protein
VIQAWSVSSPPSVLRRSWVSCFLLPCLWGSSFCICHRIAQAKAAGLWNLWLPGHLAQGLKHLLPLCSNDIDR